VIICEVLESIVSTQKNPSLHGKKIFAVQPLNEKREKSGPVILAVDSVQAGPGDVVLVCREGNGCRQILSDDGAPVNSVIAAIIDQL
jgi:microcompartment protein CcmK/EutM